LLKRDIRERNERLANEKALESVAAYARFAELSEKFFAALQKASLPPYQGPVTDFTPNSVPENWRKTTGAARCKLTEWVGAINQLDTLAATLVTGVGSDQTAFSIIGRSYCANVGFYYDMLSRYRSSPNQPHFASIISLYLLWAPRLSQTELDAEMAIHGPAVPTVPEAIDSASQSDT
jgi:hypothetical protein